jgi:hypothetical protein
VFINFSIIVNELLNALDRKISLARNAAPVGEAQVAGTWDGSPKKMMSNPNAYPWRWRRAALRHPPLASKARKKSSPEFSFRAAFQ